MAESKTFLVSTANFAYFVNKVLACTGTTNLNSSIEVSMQEQNVNAGKGNKIVYSYKYGRELNVTLEAADWKLEYLACNVGSSIAEGLTDVYKIAECATVTGGIATLNPVPIGDVAVELPNGTIVTVTPTESTIDVGTYVTEGTVNVTYKYNTNAKTVTIDAETSPMVGELILDADRHNNKLGKVGSIQIDIPSYQLSGNFNINFTPDGVASTNLDGKALAVEGDTCANGNAVYAYVHEFDNTASALTVNDIAATPGVVTLAVEEEKTLSVIGLKGAMYSPIQIDNEDCEFVSAEVGNATVTDDSGNKGVIKGVASGTTHVTVTYGDHKDVVEVTVQ